MPTKKIADWPKEKQCNDPEHGPPTMRVFEPGIYEHTCPSCGYVTGFVVRGNHITEQGHCSQCHFDGCKHAR